MVSRVIRRSGMLSLALLLVGCSGGGAPPFPAYNSMEEALGEVLQQRVVIAYQEPFGEQRALVLFRTEKHPGLSPTLLEQTGFGKWRMTGAVGLNGPLPRLGALSYGRGNVGATGCWRRSGWESAEERRVGKGPPEQSRAVHDDRAS
ncbi:MAG: hypothetical protein ACOY93_08145 [Bacillota bacterium]